MATTQIVTETAPAGRFDGWPANRATVEVIAERLLATALFNYHATQTRAVALNELKGWDELTDIQKAFLLDHAIPAAMQAIWKGR